MSDNSSTALRDRANRIRMAILSTIHHAGAGHLGSDFSAIDILVTLYFEILRVDPEHPLDPQRDRFILSKGHSSAALYATLVEAGFLARQELSQFMQPLSRLSGHPDCRSISGIEANTGPLGHGLPFAVGTALAARLDGASWRTFVLTGDGELQEGSNWEALMSAAHYRLDNLVAIVDRNGLQQGGETEQTMGLEPLSEKFKAFGWSVQQVDGHDHESLRVALQNIPFEVQRPSCLIAHTHKGQGVSFIRDQAEWHHRVPTDEELEAAMAELEGLSHDYAL